MQTHIDSERAFRRRFGDEAAWCGPGWYRKDTGEFQPSAPRDWSKERPPMVVGDIPAYESPITGKMITSRSERREDLRRSGCIEADPPKEKRKLRNPHFCAKHNMRDQLCPSVRETMDKGLKQELGYK